MIKTLTKSLVIIVALAFPVHFLGQTTLTYSGGTWSPYAPSASTGSDNVVIDDTDCTMPHGSVVNNLTINDGMSINVLANPVTVLGDLFIGRKASYAIGFNGSYLTVHGTTTIQTQGTPSSSLFNVWASPFPDATLDILGSFTGVNPCDVYTYEATTQTWKFDYSVPFSTTCNGNSVTFNSNDVINVSDGTADGKLDLGRGYFVPGVNPSTRTFTSSSTPNNGTILVPLYGSSVAIAGGNDWNLIGNPYISSLATGAMIQLNSSLINAIYIYNPNGTYDTFNSLSSFRLSSCQGFFVDLNTTTDGFVGNFEFNNTLRRTNNYFFRGHDSHPNTNVAYISLNGNNKTDQLQIIIDPDSKDDYDKKFDARKLFNTTNLNIASLVEIDPNVGPEALVFNGLKTFNDKDTKTVDLMVEIDSIGTYNIQLDSAINMPSGMSIVLEDTKTSTLTNLRTTTNYQFSSTEPDTFNTRFLLHLSYDANVTSVNEIDDQSMYSIYAENDLIKVSIITNENLALENIELYDLLGKRIKSQAYQSTTQASISSNELISGVYIVKITDSSGGIFTKRIYIQ